MARVLFLQLNHYELHGVQSIAAVLESNGHQCALLIPGLDRRPMEIIRGFRPDVVGMGIITVERAEALMWAGALKKELGCMVVLGGVDPSLNPELAMEPAVDAVVRGEGEHVMLDIADRVDKGEPITDVPGTVTGDESGRTENRARPLIQDLDTLPFPKKELYMRHPHFGRYPIKFFMASRGCPHHCSYCANPEIRAIYPNPRDYVRFKSPGYLLSEIESVLADYPARTIGFNDDLFTLRPEWMREFLPAYKRRIGLPFFCCARIDTMSEEKAEFLADAGCHTCFYGLESASQETREKVLGRRMSDRTIREGTQILHRHGIRTQSYNMMNIPGESFEDGLATLRFNQELGNHFVVASLFQPFPGTRIAKELEEKGLIEKTGQPASRENLSYFAFSSFRQKDTDRLSNLQKLFIIGHRFPGAVPLIKKLCSLPNNRLFDILFLVSFAIDYGRAHRLSMREVAVYNLRHLWTTYTARSRFVPGKF